VLQVVVCRRDAMPGIPAGKRRLIIAEVYP